MASRTVTDGRGWKRFSATQDDRFTRMWPSQRARPAPVCPSSLPSASPEDRDAVGHGGSSPGPYGSRSPPSARPPRPHPRPRSFVRPARLLLRTSRREGENIHENMPTCSHTPMTRTHTHSKSQNRRGLRLALGTCPSPSPAAASTASDHTLLSTRRSTGEWQRAPPSPGSIRPDRTIHRGTARREELEV